MSSRFPNKLITLRKHFNYSQQDIAEIMGVPVSEYMKWENGSKLCSMSQLLRLANTFKVSLDELFDNSLEVTLPNLALEDSIEIPFQAKLQNTTNIPIVDGYTEQIFPVEESHTSNLDKTLVTRIISDNTLEVIEPEETMVIKKPKQIKEVKKEPEVKKKSNLPFILGGIGVVALLTIVGFFVFNFGNKNNINEIDNTNRLVAAKEYSAYLSSEGNIITHGNRPDIKDFLDAIQISSLGNTLLGLNKDGTVVCTGVNCDVSDWEKVKMISASNTTSLGLTEEKTVLCTGSNCDVSEWTEIDFIHASDYGVYGISDGKVLYSGSLNIQDKLNSLSGVKVLTTSLNYLVTLNNTGQVNVIPLTDKEGFITNTWTNVVQIVAGKDFVAGLGSNGSVYFAGNEDIEEEVLTWNNIKYIAAHEDYIIAINNNNLMLGAGDNSYNQYENISVSPTPTDEDSSKLGKVGNIKFSENNKVLQLTWDKVENADFYQVSINVAGNYTVKTATNSLTIDSARLTPNTNYMVSIVAYSNDETKYEASDVTVVNYQYVGATPTPEVKMYKVVFYDFDGKTVLSEQSVNEGSDAIAPADPVREGYTFTGWSGNYFGISKDTKIVATYKKIEKKTYKIIFNDSNGNHLQTKVLEEGTMPEPPIMNKENSSVSWNPQLGPVSGDTTYTAVYTCTIKLENGNLVMPDASGNCYCPDGTNLIDGVCKGPEGG